MNVVLDVNVLLSALIRDSVTREIITKSGTNFYFPEPSVEKLRKYKDYIAKKAGLDTKTFEQIMVILFSRIEIVPYEEIQVKWNQARKIMEKIDQEDVIFIACALGIENSIIWSDDKHFDKQEAVRVVKTNEIMNRS